jgi:CO/xanthine dehydrogenase Mo-binding subunit
VSGQATPAAAAIGVRRPRIDAEPKVRGSARFGADLAEPGLLHARLVLSQHAHALLESIDPGEALAVPGVVSVLTARDLPIADGGGVGGRAAEPLARDEVVFAGQPIAIVVAESEAAAEDGAALVVASYRPLDPVLDVEAAALQGAPLARTRRQRESESDLGAAHAAVGGTDEADDSEALSQNVVSRRRRREGDAARALSESDAVVSGRFRTPWIYQAYLEPQTATARVEPDGELVVSTSTQGAFHARSQLAKLFGLSPASVRVVPTPLGGAFGGKVMLVEPLAAGAALAVGRPVRLAMTRSEDFVAANPGPGGVIELRIGADRSGVLTALEARIVYERGALHDWGIEGIVAVLIGGPYRWQAFDVRSYGVETNRVSFGAYRAPGAPPAAYALESLLDELATAIGADPLELRLLNAAREGDTMLDGKRWPRVGTVECLERLREHELWARRRELPPGEGVGLAVGFWPGASNAAGAACRFDEDGGITILTGSVDMSGTASGFAAVAAEAFGVPVEQVRVVAGDTAAAPRAPMSGGSQVTYSVGRAVEEAARSARGQLIAVAAAELETDPADLEIVGGAVQPRGAPGQAVPLAELAERIAGKRYEPVEARGGAAPTDLSPSVAAHLAHVRVDAETGTIRVLGWVVAQDVGRALNPDLVEGQMHGGVAQAIGWGLLEELLVDEDGQVLTGSFMDYPVPGSTEVPAIETLIVEVPSPHGPFGAKGIGEAPVVGGPAAIANAAASAAGVRLRELPMTAARVWSALHDG